MVYQKTWKPIAWHWGPPCPFPDEVDAQSTTVPWFVLVVNYMDAYNYIKPMSNYAYHFYNTDCHSSLASCPVHCDPKADMLDTHIGPPINLDYNPVFHYSIYGCGINLFPTVWSHHQLVFEVDSMIFSTCPAHRLIKVILSVSFSLHSQEYPCTIVPQHPDYRPQFGHSVDIGVWSRSWSRSGLAQMAHWVSGQCQTQKYFPDMTHLDFVAWPQTYLETFTEAPWTFGIWCLISCAGWIT